MAHGRGSSKGCSNRESTESAESTESTESTESRVRSRRSRKAVGGVEGSRRSRRQSTESKAVGVEGSRRSRRQSTESESTKSNGRNLGRRCGRQAGGVTGGRRARTRRRRSAPTRSRFGRLFVFDLEAVVDGGGAQRPGEDIRTAAVERRPDGSAQGGNAAVHLDSDLGAAAVVQVEDRDPLPPAPRSNPAVRHRRVRASPAERQVGRTSISFLRGCRLDYDAGKSQLVASNGRNYATPPSRTGVSPVSGPPAGQASRLSRGLPTPVTEAR